MSRRLKPLGLILELKSNLRGCRLQTTAISIKTFIHRLLESFIFCMEFVSFFAKLSQTCLNFF